MHAWRQRNSTDRGVQSNGHNFVSDMGNQWKEICREAYTAAFSCFNKIFSRLRFDGAYGVKELLNRP